MLVSRWERTTTFEKVHETFDVTLSIILFYTNKTVNVRHLAYYPYIGSTLLQKRDEKRRSFGIRFRVLGNPEKSFSTTHQDGLLVLCAASFAHLYPYGGGHYQKWRKPSGPVFRHLKRDTYASTMTSNYPVNGLWRVISNHYQVLRFCYATVLIYNRDLQKIVSVESC